MRFCEKIGCGKPVFGTDKKTRIGYCKSHQYLRTDIDKAGILERAIKKQRQSAIVNDIRKLRKEDLRLTDNNAVKELDERDRWFKDRRKEMAGICQCGCGKPSSKYDDKYFKHSCSHVFPKRLFKSIATHPRNFVERAFWGGCHTNMDEQSMDKWVGFSDWENIKEIFHELAPLLTDEERKTKFYSHFERLIYNATTS